MKTPLILVTAIALVALLAGCSTMTTPGIVVSLSFDKTQTWTITGALHSVLYGPTTLSVYINGNLIGSGQVAGTQPTSITGTFQNHKVQTVCPSGLGASFSCQVYVDGKYTATLPFS